MIAEDEVEAEVEHRLRGDLLAQPMHGLGQRLARVLVGHDEGQHRREPGVGRRQRPAAPVVVLGPEMHVAIDGAREHELAAGVDRPGGRRQRLHGPEGHDAAVAHADGGVHDLGGGDDAPAGDDEVEGGRRHDGLIGCVIAV